MVVGLLALSFFFGTKMPMPESFDDVVRVGCSCVQTATPRQPYALWWQTRVWVEYPGERVWVRLYSIRGGGERKRALKDCDAWISEFYKRARKKR
ncbi:MAG TPA: hypothetical protein VEA41_18855 [Salinarimonas sp.]|nr:hypothetical protein [Salinarimonas sp.]